jgi:hypothetical protein
VLIHLVAEEHEAKKKLQRLLLAQAKEVVEGLWKVPQRRKAGKSIGESTHSL